jgi:S-adenosylmethionine decarboxylase
LFGPHLIIDGSRCDTHKLADRILVEQVMNEYPAAIGMTKIGGPYMFEYQAPDPAYSGVSGIVVIAESHIAIHTFPELDYFTLDIFSCKNFDHELAIDYIRQAFDVKEMDRMLVQRGLSFRGPHHGKLGATDELIAAAEARLAAGIISKETVVPGELGVPAALDHDRATAAERRGAQTQPALQAGRMLWPQYGVTPDIGTYGAAAAADCDDCAREGATILPLHTAGAATIQPVQVNPTASISGLLDKLATSGGQGRALGRALAQWEKLAHDADATIALTLSAPVIADGLRELLVYVVEHRYADVVVATADDLFADLYESLGHAHVASEDGATMTAEGMEAALTFFARFLDELHTGALTAGADLWRALGEALPAAAPRKGLLQAAAAAGVRIFATGLSAGPFASAVLAARARGLALPLDPSDDVLALARLLAEAPRLGVVRAGIGSADALLAQARASADLLELAPTTLVGSVTLGSARTCAEGAGHVAVRADAALALPLLLTGLAQRVPGYRRAAPRRLVETPAAAAALA